MFMTEMAEADQILLNAQNFFILLQKIQLAVF